VVILTGTEIRDKGMGMFWAVGKAATSAPRLVAVHYQGRKDSTEVDLAIVGKGVTFDTGGLNLKLHMIEKMHGDKGGSTAVLGAL